jgi:hypothetical protein
MSEILTLNKDKQTFQSNDLSNLMKTLEAEGKITKIDKERVIGKPLTTFLAVVNEHPDTVYYINVELGERHSAQDEPTREYFINYPIGGKTVITDKIVTENPPTISVWEVVKTPQTPPAPVPPTPKKGMFDRLNFWSKGGRKSKKQRKSRKSKQRKSRRSRR